MGSGNINWKAIGNWCRNIIKREGNTPTDLFLLLERNPTDEDPMWCLELPPDYTRHRDFVWNHLFHKYTCRYVYTQTHHSYLFLKMPFLVLVCTRLLSSPWIAQKSSLVTWLSTYLPNKPISEYFFFGTTISGFRSTVDPWTTWV